MAYRFKIIASGLLDALVRCYRSVTCCACQILAVFVWDVLTLTILVGLGETKVDDVYVVACGFRATDKEVIRLNIAVDDSLIMNFLDPSHHLTADLENSFEIKGAFAALEQIFK